MKNSLKKNRIKMRSLDNKDVHRIKKGLKKNKKFNQTVTHSKSPLKQSKKSVVNADKEDDISLLSNANLNIIKILNNCANEDILNESSLIFFNNDNISLDTIKKDRKYLKDSSKNKFNNFNNTNSNKIVALNSNISDLSSESLKSENQKIFSPHDSKIKIKEKEKENVFHHKSISNKEIRLRQPKITKRKFSEINTYLKFNSFEDLNNRNKDQKKSNSFVFKKTSSFIKRINRNFE